MRVRIKRGLRRETLYKKKRIKKLLPAAGLLTVTLFLLWFVPFTVRGYRTRRIAEAEIAARRQAEAGTFLSEGQGVPGEYLEYNDRIYKRNPSVHAILCLGVDTSGEMERYQAPGYAGQADGIFLAAHDAARDTVQILMIPRDTMTEITLFDLMGNELGKDVQHLTLAFAYGDGREKSCELMREAVSELLSGLDIDHYLAMNTDSIALLNDEIGGVEVFIGSDELERADPAFIKGNTVHLKGTQAERFLRYRDITRPQTALSRMERQKQYIANYIGTAKSAAAADDNLITRLVNDTRQHMVTDMTKDQYMELALAVLNSGQAIGEEDLITVPGQAVETELFDEYHPDKEALKQIVIDLFYREVRGNSSDRSELLQ